MGLQLLLAGGLVGHQVLVQQARLVTANRFLSVLEDEDVFPRDPRVLGGLPTEIPQRDETPLVGLQLPRVLQIPQEAHLSDRQQPTRRPGMSRDDQVKWCSSCAGLPFSYTRKKVMSRS
jgi:hypothetical protein